MEGSATYHAAGRPVGPRNLSAPLAAWLRVQGFMALERAYAPLAVVSASWSGPRGERFDFYYEWTPVLATCTLRVLPAGQLHYHKLFRPQHMRRLKDARQLLNNCVRYAMARALARLLPTT